jgi:hypothetical protein
MVGVFQLEYNEWNFFPDNEKTIANAWIWWTKKI